MSKKVEKVTAQRTMRCIGTEFKTRAAEDGELYIEGYFSVFSGIYELGDWGVERVDPHAFDETINDDIRALVNHNTTLVLGRTSAGTLELSIDNYGLFGRIRINQQDQDAMNLYQRVLRGDVSQCSFGFDILAEAEEILPDGRYQWTLLRVKLYEVSVVTFPAYEDTSVKAREKDRDELRSRAMQAWRAEMKTKIAKKKEEK